MDYLVEEVLKRQPGPIRRFLLQTAILDRLSGSLCDAVTGGEDGAARLEALQRGNFFVIPLDDKRAWYRYHHLFAGVLRLRLMAEQPDQVSALHRRASEWYEHHGSAADAIHHALAAEDFERAANLAELAKPAMSRNRQMATLLGWLKQLPDDLIRCRPVLNVDYALALMACGQLEGVEARLQEAERRLTTTGDVSERPEAPAVGMVVVDEEEFRRLPGMIPLIRAALALDRGDMAETVKHARRVLDLAPKDDHLMRGGAASQLGLAAWTNGDLEAARRMTADGMTHMRLVGNISDAIGGSIVLADIQIAQGCLHEAMATYQRALQWATEPGAPVRPGAADMVVGMSALHREHNDLETATQLLLTSQALGELAGLQQNPYRWRAAMARIREAQGDLDGALDLLDEAERLYDGAFSPNVRPVAARRARVWAAQGRLGDALGWARERGLSVEDDLSYLHEFDHITLARVLLARYQSDHADGSMSAVLGLLERLLKAAEEGGRKGSVIEILVVQAIAYHAQGNLAAALVPLRHALALAEPEGYVRMFLDEGPSMRHLLREASTRGIMPDYTGKLLAAFGVERKGSRVSCSPRLAERRSYRSVRRRCRPPHCSPSSNRSARVSWRSCAYCPEGSLAVRSPERLFLALSTVKGHNQHHLYKLKPEPHRALTRARDLGLL